MTPAMPDSDCMDGSIVTPADLPPEPPGGCARGLWLRMRCDDRQHKPAEYVCDEYTEREEEDVEVPAHKLSNTQSFGPPDTGGRFRPRGSPVQQSRNWSGAWLTPTQGRRFIAVWGAWTVPASPDGLPDGLPPRGQRRAPDAARCSHWVGIGGHRRHSLSLPQVGTMAAIDWRGRARYYAWYQWWERTRSYGPLRITNLEVQAGDPVVAAVTVQGPGIVRLYIRNERTGQLRSIQWQAKASSPVVVDGKSAEWVVERPSWFDRDDKPHFFPLPPLGRPDRPVRFECCGAVAAEAPAEPGTARDLTGARLVRMVGRRGDGPGSRFLAVPERRGPGVLDVAIRGG